MKRAHIYHQTIEALLEEARRPRRRTKRYVARLSRRVENEVEIEDPRCEHGVSIYRVPGCSACEEESRE